MGRRKAIGISGPARREASLYSQSDPSNQADPALPKVESGVVPVNASQCHNKGDPLEKLRVCHDFSTGNDVQNIEVDEIDLWEVDDELSATDIPQNLAGKQCGTQVPVDILLQSPESFLMTPGGGGRLTPLRSSSKPQLFTAN